jgi:hypothetical protein
MPRANFAGLSKSKNGTWKVHYQHHNPTLRFGIKSKPGKYFSIKQNDNGGVLIKHYNKTLRIDFDTGDNMPLLNKYCELIKCPFEDLEGVLQQYMQYVNIHKGLTQPSLIIL